MLKTLLHIAVGSRYMLLADKKISCKTCKNEYNAYDGMPTQAYRCSCEVFSNELRGYYGSTVADGMVYEFDNRPIWVQDGLICDECIERLLNEKKLIVKRSDYWIG